MITLTIDDFYKNYNNILNNFIKKDKYILLKDKKDKIIAKVLPMDDIHKQSSWLGCMIGSASITGDIMAPAMSETDWEVLH
jgi:hypothetical protein